MNIREKGLKIRRKLQYDVIPTKFQIDSSQSKEVKIMLIKEVPKSNSSSVMLLTGAFIVTATLTMIYFFAS